MIQSRAPLIIAIVLLLLPVLYVGSYLALVVPGGDIGTENATGYYYIRGGQYRVDGERIERLFWPLEQIDRKLRPGAWNLGSR
jgi:hypothetical protein